MSAVTILLQATAIMLVLILLRPLWKRCLSARFRCALWALPALRLLLPFQWRSPLSVMAPAETISTGFDTMAQQPLPPPSWLGSGTGMEAVGGDAAAVTQGAVQIQGPATLSLGSLLALLWLAGALVTGGIIICQNLRFYAAIKRRSQLLEEHYGLPVYLVKGLPSPCLAGPLRPRIYVNECALASREVLDMALRHEHTHYRRLDHIWNLLRGLLLSLYWFHPLIWISSELFRSDCETACDDAATRGMDQAARQQYGMALIALAARAGDGSTGRLVCLSTLSGSKKLLRERITHLARGRSFRAAAVIALLLAAVLSLTMCTTPGEIGDTPDVSGITAALPAPDEAAPPEPAPPPGHVDTAEDTPVPRQGEAGTLEDFAYHLELTVPGGDFGPMDPETAGTMIEDYGELLKGFHLMARVSADGSIRYVAGKYMGALEDNPLQGIYSVELRDAHGENPTQLLYEEKDSAAAEKALTTGQAPGAGWHITNGSVLSYTKESNLILIHAKDCVGALDVARSRYLHTPNGRAYIRDAVSRGIALNTTEPPFLYVYLINETYGEIAERIPLTGEQAAAILSEELAPVTEGGGFSASLHLEDGTVYFTERSGVPPSVMELAVEKCGYRFADPSHITGPIVSATLECSWLTEPLYADASDLARLESILKGAEFGYVGACGYGARLTLELTGGETLTVFKGTDSCDSIVFGSYGGYFLGDRENTEFWQLFGLDPETKEPTT